MVVVIAGIIGLALFAAFTYYTVNTVFTSAQDVNDWRQQYNAISDLSVTIIDVSGDAAITEINALPGLTLPDDATNARFGREGVTNPSFWLRFDLPPDLLPGFLAGTCFDEPALSADFTPAFAYDTDPDVRILLEWWEPTPSENNGGQCDLQAGVSLQLLVNQSNADLWRVYLEIVTS